MTQSRISPDSVSDFLLALRELESALEVLRAGVQRVERNLDSFPKYEEPLPDPVNYQLDQAGIKADLEFIREELMVLNRPVLPHYPCSDSWGPRVILSSGNRY